MQPGSWARPWRAEGGATAGAAPPRRNRELLKAKRRPPAPKSCPWLWVPARRGGGWGAFPPFSAWLGAHPLGALMGMGLRRLPRAS